MCSLHAEYDVLCMRVIFNHYVKKYLVTSPLGPGPVRFGPGPQPATLLFTGPGLAPQVSDPHPARPAKYYSGLVRASPWAAGRPGPRAETRPVQDPKILRFNQKEILYTAFVILLQFSIKKSAMIISGVKFWLLPATVCFRLPNML